jgi:hypothetical protein
MKNELVFTISPIKNPVLSYGVYAFKKSSKGSERAAVTIFSVYRTRTGDYS